MFINEERIFTVGKGEDIQVGDQVAVYAVEGERLEAPWVTTVSNVVFSDIHKGYMYYVEKDVPLYSNHDKESENLLIHKYDNFRKILRILSEDELEAVKNHLVNTDGIKTDLLNVTVDNDLIGEGVTIGAPLTATEYVEEVSDKDAFDLRMGRIMRRMSERGETVTYETLASLLEVIDTEDGSE